MLKARKVDLCSFRFAKILSVIIALGAMGDLILCLGFCPFSRILMIIGWGVCALCYFKSYHKAVKINKKYPQSKLRVDAKYFLYCGIGCAMLALFGVFYGKDYVFAQILCAIIWLTIAFTIGLIAKHSFFMKTL